MSNSPLIEKMKATIQRHGMLDGSRRVLIAVSGGPDSLTLLHLLTRICRADEVDITLHAGHLHHGMRGSAADEDAAFVKRECKRLGIPCTLSEADVPAMARATGVGEEVAGRNARYAFLTRLASSIGAERIAFGHHADDQAETVLMRVMRGAGPRGMCGIPYVRRSGEDRDIRIIRPLLDCWRSEIESFLQANKLDPRLDVTNLSPKYLRNRLRHTIMPAMEAMWGTRLRKDLYTLAVLAERLRCRLRGIIPELERTRPVDFRPEHVECGAPWLATMPPSIIVELIQRWLGRVGIGQQTPTRAHYAAILKQLANGRGRLILPGNIEACCSTGRFALRRADKDASREFAVTLNVPGTTAIECLGATIEAEILAGDHAGFGEAAGNTFEEFFDYDRISFPLQVRFRRPGDRMKPLGAPGTRRLKKIMMELGIPAWERNRTPIVTMHDESIWVVGYRIADDVRVREGTQRMLRLRYFSPSLSGCGSVPSS